LTSDSLPEFSWRGIKDPGAYVDMASGELFRISQDALVPNSSPIIRRESILPSRLFKISDDPAIPSHEARMICIRNNIKPNF